MFSIDYPVGPLGAIILALLAGVAIIAALIFFSIVKRARDDVIEDEQDRGNDDVPIA